MSFSIARAKLMIVISSLALLFTLLMNALANILPINGVTTGFVSDSYPNLFAPDGITFAIWAVIYIALTAFTAFELIKLGRYEDSPLNRMLFPVHIAYAGTSIANGIWILFWHYRIIWVTVILTAMIFGFLVYINLVLKKQNWVLRLPFSIYFGWVTIALIANITTYLVDVGYSAIVTIDWNQPGAVLHMVGLLYVASIIAIVTIWRQRDLAYGAVILWALTGILIKHLTVFDNAYSSVTETTIIMIGLVASFMLAVYFIYINPKLLFKTDTLHTRK